MGTRCLSGAFTWSSAGPPRRNDRPDPLSYGTMSPSPCRLVNDLPTALRKCLRPAPEHYSPALVAANPCLVAGIVTPDGLISPSSHYPRPYSFPSKSRVCRLMSCRTLTYTNHLVQSSFWLHTVPETSTPALDLFSTSAALSSESNRCRIPLQCINLIAVFGTLTIGETI